VKKIAVASGKGGTGKTTFSVLLSKILSEKYRVHLVDCDVEEPNCYLFLKSAKSFNRKKIHVFTPVIDLEKCDFCGKCTQVCKFRALILINRSFLKFNELCHACKGCMLVCPKKAISEGKREVGEMLTREISPKIFFSYARMNVSEARATPLISHLKTNLRDDVDFTVFDSPPGASCPVVEVVRDADFVVLVTEPTPFGLFDLKIAWQVIKELKKKAAIVINKSGKNDSIIENFAKKENIEIFLKIPFSIEFARQYSSGKISLNFFPEVEKKVLDFFKENGII